MAKHLFIYLWKSGRESSVNGKISDVVLGLNNSCIKDIDSSHSNMTNLIIMTKFSDLGLLNNGILNLAGVICGYAKHINIF